MSAPSENDKGLLLAGLDGSNPLAFLAALGTLRTLARVWPKRGVKLGWQCDTGCWRPTIVTSPPADAASVVSVMRPELSRAAQLKAFRFAADLKLPPDKFTSFIRLALIQWHDGSDPRCAEFAGAFGSEALTNKDGTIQDTAFRTMSGAGRQHFLAFMAELARATNGEHLRMALFNPWHYEERKLSMRWDPFDDRRYALRWSDPSGDVIHTVRGANRLAIEALPLFPVAPVGAALRTTGFGSPAGRGVFWTWPIWEPSLPVDTVRSILALPGLQEDSPDRLNLAARGITEIFRCERITVGKFRNFTPPQPV
jgi:hypothetical protein